MHIRIRLITLTLIRMRIWILIFIWCGSGFIFNSDAGLDPDPTFHPDAQIGSYSIHFSLSPANWFGSGSGFGSSLSLWCGSGCGSRVPKWSMRIRIYNTAYKGRKCLCRYYNYIGALAKAIPARHCLFSVPSVRAEGTGEVYNRKGAALIPKLCRHIQGSCWDSLNLLLFVNLSTCICTVKLNPFFTTLEQRWAAILKNVSFKAIQIHNFWEKNRIKRYNFGGQHFCHRWSNRKNQTKIFLKQ